MSTIGNLKMNVACFLYCVTRLFEKAGDTILSFSLNVFFKGKEPLIPVFQYVYDVTSMYI